MKQNSQNYNHHARVACLEYCLEKISPAVYWNERFADELFTRKLSRLLVGRQRSLLTAGLIFLATAPWELTGGVV